MSPKIARAHLYVGATGFLIFVLTGQYMALQLDGLLGMDDGHKVLLRTSHIFIMLASLSNICIGAYAHSDRSGWIQCVISAVFLVSPFMMTLEFFYGTDNVDTPRPFAYYMLILLFAAGVLMVIESVVKIYRK